MATGNRSPTSLLGGGRRLQLPVTGRSTADDVADAIRSAIVSGGLEPGQRLKEANLARELNISRTPVREALQMLTRDGLVDSLPNRGSTVRAYRLEEIEEVCELRAVLEGRAAFRAASRITPDELSRLTASHRRSADLLDSGAPGQVADEDKVFHGIIVGAAHSPRLARLVSDVSELPLDYRLMLWHGRTADERRAAVNDHVELAGVLARRDGVAAETLMRGHLLDAAVQLAEAGRYSMPIPRK